MSPLQVAPNIIEVTDFTGGWRPDAEPSNVPPNALLDVTNLLLDPASGAIVSRKGLKRIVNLDEGFRVRTLHPYNRIAGGATTGEYLIAVATNGTQVRVYAINLGTQTATRIDNGVMPFSTATGVHWGATIGGRFYGGGDGVQMYAWDPDSGWDPNPANPDFPTLVNNRNPLAGQRAYDFAFEDGDEVLYTDPVTNTTQAYSVAKGHGFKKRPWEDGRHYKKGTVVTRKSTYDDGKGNTGAAYRRAYECRKDHEADATNRPGDGTAMTADGSKKKWLKFWRPLALTLPRDENGEVTDDWDLIPTAATTSIGIWHGERLWLRYDNVNTRIGKSRLQFSAPAKRRAKSDIGEFTWSPKDWRVGAIRTDDLREDDVEGGGWFDVRTGDGDPITCLLSFGYYLLIFKRRSTHVLAGMSEASWTRRELSNEVGAVGPRAAADHEGFVYFVSDQGLMVTDGTQVLPAPGSEVVRDWMRRSVDWSGELTNAVVWSFGKYLWVSLPGAGTLVYEPGTKTFWKLDFVASAAAVNRRSGRTELYLARESDSARALVLQYDHPDVQNAPTDDNGAALYGTQSISWGARFAWFPFGAVREERRVRRIWALVRGSPTSATLKARRNFSDTVVWSKAVTPTASASYVEGQVLPDCFAVNLELSGSGAPVAVLGLGVDTQPRRIRYHV